MIILLGVGIATTITVFYLGKKSWYALHTAVGITPGVLTYQDPKTPLALPNLTWQQLDLDSQHLSVLPDNQLRQLQGIDNKVAVYHRYQQQAQSQNLTLAITEQQFVLHKLLQLRLPEMLASHYYLTRVGLNGDSNVSTQVNATNDKLAEAGQLLQVALNNIESRLDKLLEQVDIKHLQDLRVMSSYIDSHNV